MIQKDTRQMIRVKKIAHATYETPDLDQQVEYYTDVLGLNLVARDKDAAYLASTLDHHSVVLRKGGAAQCVRLGFQVGADDDLDAFEKQTAAHGIKTQRAEGSGADRLRHGRIRGPEGHLDGGVQAAEPQAQKFPIKGIVPHKIGHVAFHCADVKLVTKFYLRRARLPGIRLDGGLLLVPALRRRPSHHQPDGHRQQPSLPHRVRAARLEPYADGVRFPQPQRLQAALGPGRHGIGHNLFCYHRGPNGLITELFAELDRMNEELGYFEPRPWHRDRPQRPKVWAKDPNASNYWGITPPEEMMK